MELHLAQFLTIGLFIILSLLIFQYYWNLKKKYASFPFFHVIPYILFDLLPSKILKENTIDKVFLQKINEVAEQYKKEGMFLIYELRTVLFVFGEAPVKAIINAKSAVNRPPEYLPVIQLFGHGIGTSNGERWRLQKKTINPAFQISMLKEKVLLFNEHAMNLVKDMENLVEEPYIDILNVLKCHYFNSLSESVFGLKQSKENSAKILKFCKRIERMTSVAVKSFVYPWFRSKLILKLSPSGRKFYKDLKEVDEFISMVISQMQKNFSSTVSMDTEMLSAHFRKSFTYLLLSQHFKDPTFTFQDVHGNVKSIALAGYHTVAYTTMWCLYLLGLYPEIQEKVYNEVLSLTSEYVTHEECSNLSYLESVILETLRIYSTIPIFPRQLSEDVVCDKYTIPKGTIIAFLPYIIHKNPEMYPDPEEFIPERFLNAEKRSTVFIPFAEGGRSCIGKKYALLEMKVFLAHILQSFKITSLDKREDVSLRYTVVLSPEKPLRMKITPRT